MIIFDQAECRDLLTARHREWIETNGIGGYASSTIVGAKVPLARGAGRKKASLLG